MCASEEQFALSFFSPFDHDSINLLAAIMLITYVVRYASHEKMEYLYCSSVPHIMIFHVAFVLGRSL